MYILGFLAVVVVVVFSVAADESRLIPESGGVPTAFLIMFVLHLFTIVLSLGLLVVYLVDVFRNPVERSKSPRM